MSDPSSRSSASRSQAGPVYRERLWVPVGWWLLGALFALSLLVAVLFYLGPGAAIATFVICMGVLAVAFVRYGSLMIKVTEDRLWVGAANIEWRYIAEARAHDEAATRQRRGPQADARAFMTLRPYLSRTVEITLDDPDDPTPYWLIGTRSPDRLADAIRARCNRSDGTGSASLEE